MIKKTKAVIFGDVNLDIHPSENLLSSFSDSTTSSRVHFSKLAINAGGTSINLANACLSEGLIPHIYAVIGNDFAGQYLRNEIEKMGISATYEIKPAPTGIAVLIWDSQGSRLMLNSEENANHFLSESSVSRCLCEVVDADIVFINGYSLRRKETPRYLAIIDMLVKRNKNQVSPFIVFDLAPHNLHEILDKKKFDLICKKSDALSFEISTARRFLRVGDKNEKISKSMASETIKLLRSEYPELSLLGFFGKSGCGQYIRMMKSESVPLIASIEVPSGSKIKGLSDRIIVKTFSAPANKLSHA